MPVHSGNRTGRKRIAIVLPSLAGGGVERVRIELARQFLRQGYEVDFLLLARRGELLGECPEGSELHSLETPLRRSLLPLTAYLKRRRPDAILGAMWPLTGIIALAVRLSRSRARLVVSEHAHLSRSRHQNALSKWLLRHAGHYLLSRADIVCVSEGVRDDLATLTRIERDRIHVIHNPIRAHLPDGPIPDRLRSWWCASPHRLLAVGRLTEQKDYPTLLRALAITRRSRDARLVILGEGPERSRLEGLRSQLSLEDVVELPGFSSEIGTYFSMASLLVLSSQWEGLGNVITEALSQGVPVVATDCPSGPAELLDDGKYGRLVRPGDPAALAKAIDEALGEETDRNMLKARAAEFSIERAAARYLALLDPSGAVQAP